FQPTLEPVGSGTKHNKPLLDREPRRLAMLTDLNLKCNDNQTDCRFSWPIISAEVMHDGIETEIFARFMRHMRNVPNSRTEIKVLSSIQFTADMMDMSDALVAKILVDMGL